MLSKYFFLIALLLLCLKMQAQKKPVKIPAHSIKADSQPAPAAKLPRLVIGIIVDQMRFDYLYRYYNKFGTGGFRRLMDEGFFCRNTSYNYVPTYTGPGHASIYTGTTPAIHGIVSNDWFRREKNDTLYCVRDENAVTVGAANSAGKMSPRNLISTTVTDELRYATNFKSKVIGISMKDRGAILPAGHAANAAYWYDAQTGNWITSSYYMNEIPEWVKSFNAKQLSEKYLNTPWTTIYPIESYTESTPDNVPYEGPYSGESKPVFPHDFPKIKTTGYELIRRSPWGNALTKDFALAAIEHEQLGTDDIPDFLCISFSCTDYVGHQFGTNSVETEDTYLRLDRDLQEILEILDSVIGKNNALVFLTADHAAIPNPVYLSDNKIPSGYFNTQAMIDSLTKFMASEYGENKFISCVENNQVYINRDEIEKRRLKTEDVSENIATFLMRLSDVAQAITAGTLNKNEFSVGPRALVQNGFNAQRSGDVMIITNPGLIEWETKTGTTHGSAYSYDTHVPLLWYGWKIKAGQTARPVGITDIAPTLSSLLNIEFPNGTTGKVIYELVK